MKIRIQDEGSIVILYGVDGNGWGWLEASLLDPCPRWGKGYAIEHRYVDNVLDAFLASGGEVIQ